MNRDLPPLPTDDEVVAAVRRLVQEAQEKMERAQRRYFVDPRPTATQIARSLGIHGARRAGNGAVKGSWSGTMSPSLRIAPRLRSLTANGRLVRSRDREMHRYVYDIPGEEWWRCR